MTKQMTPLRQRMIEDMTIRNMSPSTKKIYVRAVANFSIYHGCPPDNLTAVDVRDYRLHLISRGLKVTSINPIMGALRFFYGMTLGQKHVSEQIPYAREEDTLPAVLARKQTHPEHWLFPGPNPVRPITTRSVERACRRAAEAAGLDKTVTVHTLRHSFATHLLEQGVDIHVIQDLLGHRNIASTTRYARVAINTIRQVQSPLELLNMEMAAPA